MMFSPLRDINTCQDLTQVIFSQIWLKTTQLHHLGAQIAIKTRKSQRKTGKSQNRASGEVPMPDS